MMSENFFKPLGSNLTERPKQPSGVLDIKKFYIFSEGTTEILYFDGVRRNSQRIGISNRVEIKLVKKKEGYLNQSDATNIKNAIIAFQEENVEKIDKEIDEFCLVFDRDVYNTIDRDAKFNTLIEDCDDKQIFIVLTNPCFEFWLFMHVADINNYDKAELLKNIKVNRNKRFLEKELSEINGGYNKSNLKFSVFLKNIEKAIEQEKKVEQDVGKMKGKLGSNVGLLIKKMKNESEK
jgi:hypothetical protein